MRELSDAVVRDQTDALEAYLLRGGDASVWLASKEFTREDAAAIRIALSQRKREREGRSA